MTGSRMTRLVVAVAAVAAILASAPSGAAALSNPNDFCTGDPCQITSNKTADADITLDFGTRSVVLSAILTIGKRPLDNMVGNLTIRAGSFAIIGNGQIEGVGGSNHAGSVTIETTGNIQVDGTRATGAFRLPGTDAGAVSLFAGGDVYGEGHFNLSNSSILGGGGNLSVGAGGLINLTGSIDANGGAQGFGGTVDMAATENITASGGINLSGGESGGGTLDMFAEGSIVLGSLNLSAGGDAGDGGFANVLALGDLRMNGSVTGNGADNGIDCGDAGEVDLSADGDIFINASVTMRGRGLDCFGGSLTLDGNVVNVLAVIDLSSTGTEGFGGDIDFSAASTMAIVNTLRTDGADGAGDVLISSDGNISLGGSIRAEGRGTFGTGASLVDIDSGGTLAMSGSVIAFGGSQGQGGEISISGCTVFQGSLSTIDTRSANGQITVSGNDSITLHGSFFGEFTTVPPIEIHFRLGGTPPNIGSATFNLPPALVASPLIQPCALCASNTECDDGNPCTDDLCIPATGCSNTANTNPCDDGNACTTGDICANSVCAGPTPVVCNDGNACTDDSCDPQTGCKATPNTAPCDDGDPCTENDICTASSCSGTLINCNDGNPCTDNVCVGGACQSFDNSAPCDDGDACTANDACDGGSCQSGPAAVCEDGDPCTVDSCSSVSGCVFTPIEPCEDSDADGDGIPDVEDVCTTLDWSATPQSPPNQQPLKMALSITKLTKPRGEQGLLFKGWFNVAAPASPLQPDVDGIHFSVADADGVLYDVDIPGGAVGASQNCGPRDGWSSVIGTKSRWKYANKSGAFPPACVPGSALGVSTLQIKDIRASKRSAIQFKVGIKKTSIDRVPALPLTRIQGNLVFGTQPAPGQASAAAIAGQCAEGVITGTPIADGSPKPFCKQRMRNGFLEKLVCQGP